jgi:hypothetical protein
MWSGRPAVCAISVTLDMNSCLQYPVATRLSLGCISIVARLYPEYIWDTNLDPSLEGFIHNPRGRLTEQNGDHKGTNSQSGCVDDPGVPTSDDRSFLGFD